MDSSFQKTFFSFLFFFLVGFNYSHAQRFTSNDFKCYNKGAYAAFDFLETTRSYGNYEPEDEWSQLLTSDQIVKKTIELEGGRQYVILLTTERGADATAVEIRDETGMQLEYSYQINELNKEELNLFFTPDNDGRFQVYFRVINSGQASSCSYMAILKGDIDPEYDEGRSIDK